MSPHDCKALCVPEPLIQGARQSFDFDPSSDELLFRRIRIQAEDHTLPMEGRHWFDLLAANLPMKSDSYNRSTVWDNPSSVLFSDEISNCAGPHFAANHIVMFVPLAELYGDSGLEQQLTQADFSQRVRFRAKHTPRPCNFSHTDLLVEQEGPDGTWTPFALEVKPPSLKRVVRLFLITRAKHAAL